MPERGIRSTYSQCPFQLLVLDQNSQVISCASAFFYDKDGEYYVITNWHVVSGRHFMTRKPLAEPFREPISLTLKLASYNHGNRKDGTFAIGPIDIPLYRGEKPVWFEHPELGPHCDMVAIPFDKPKECPPFMHNAANRISNPNIPLEPGCTIFVIGFPQALSTGFGLPLWKSGYVASEPHYDVVLGGKNRKFGGLEGGLKIPAFFIDAQTRSGMSGSPVFARYYGMWDRSNPYQTVDLNEPGFWGRDDIVLFGPGTMFIGCYSGRTSSAENEATLGLCWGTGVIDAVCAGRKPGNNPHINSGLWG